MFILKEIKSKKHDESNGDFVAKYFLEMFHQGVKQANIVFLPRLQMLKLMPYVLVICNVTIMSSFYLSRYELDSKTLLSNMNTRTKVLDSISNQHLQK